MLEPVVAPIASHPQRDGCEAEEKGQDRQAGEESSAKDCEDTMSHEIQIVTKGVEQSSAARLAPVRSAGTRKRQTTAHGAFARFERFAISAKMPPLYGAFV